MYSYKVKSAQVFEYINHRRFWNYSKDAADFPKVIKRSRNVADGMSSGIDYLLKKNKIEVINGFGKVLKSNKISVPNGKSTEYSKHIIMTTGLEVENFQIYLKTVRKF